MLFLYNNFQSGDLQEELLNHSPLRYVKGRIRSMNSPSLSTVTEESSVASTGRVTGKKMSGIHITENDRNARKWIGRTS